jgi:hypothetical protein
MASGLATLTNEKAVQNPARSHDAKRANIRGGRPDSRDFQRMFPIQQVSVQLRDPMA